MKCAACKFVVPIKVAVKEDNDRFAPVMTATKIAYLEARGHCHRYPPAPGGYPVVVLDSEGCGEGAA